MSSGFVISKKGKHELITVKKETITFSMLNSLRQSLRDLTESGAIHFIFDLSQLKSFNSQFFGILADLFNQIDVRGGSCHVVVTQPEQKDLFELSGLNMFVKIVHHVDEIVTIEEPDLVNAEETIIFQNNLIDIIMIQGMKIFRGKKELHSIKAAMTFNEIIGDQVTNKDKTLVLDFSGLTQLNSAFISSISTLYRRARINEGSLFIIYKDKYIDDILEISGLRSFILTFRTRDDFFKYIRRKKTIAAPHIILVVHDSLTESKTITKKLIAQGYRVIFAKNKKDTLELAQTHNPDLFLIRLAGGVGFKVCKELRNLIENKSIPIIYMIGVNETQDRIAAFKSGANDYIFYPIQEEELNIKVKTHLKIQNLTEEIERFNDNLEQKIEDRVHALVETEKQIYQVEKMSAVSMMISGIAHEMKNPLFIIGGQIDRLLQKEKLTKNQAEIVESIGEQTHKSTHIIDNMLKLARQKVNNVIVLDLQEVVNNISDNISYLIADKSINLVKQLSPQCSIHGNITEIEQMILILVSNAVDAITDEGTIIIKIEDLEAKCLVYVEDNGCGMSEDTLKKIYHPFFTTKEVGKGTGLGMSIVHRAVNAHRGKIQITSALGKGTQCSIYFPKV